MIREIIIRTFFSFHETWIWLGVPVVWISYILGACLIISLAVVILASKYWRTSAGDNDDYTFNMFPSQFLWPFMHYNDVIMATIASQITSFTIVYSIVYSDADQRKHQSSASLAFVWGIHRGPVNSPHKWPVTRNMFPFDDVIMDSIFFLLIRHYCTEWISRNIGTLRVMK